MPWWWDCINWTLVFTIVAAGATVLQAVVAWEMKKSLTQARRSADAAEATQKIMSDTAERQLRAYLDAPPVTATPFIPGQPIIVNVQFKNTGQTPARRVRMNMIAQLLSRDGMLELEAHLESEDGSETTVGAGARVTMIREISWDVWRVHHSALARGDLVLATAGWCSYNDVFGKPRHTSFRRFRRYSDGVEHLLAASSGNTAT